jgi:hypothetical protein
MRGKVVRRPVNLRFLLFLFQDSRALPAHPVSGSSTFRLSIVKSDRCTQHVLDARLYFGFRDLIGTIPLNRRGDH